jgi:hypothetical protein
VGKTHSPLGAPAQFIEASCMRPASPFPPVALGLQVDSCMAKEARRMGGTGRQYKSHVIDETRTAIGVSVLLEGPEVWCTWSKDTVGV